MRTERDIDEARRHLERVERRYTDATVFQTSLEKEIATYRELLDSKYKNLIFRVFFSFICFLYVKMVFEDVLIELYKMLNKKLWNDLVVLVAITIVQIIEKQQRQEPFHILISIQQIQIMVM